MNKAFNAIDDSRSRNARWLIRAAVAAAISGSCAMSAMAQEAPAAAKKEAEPSALQEVSVTGSRIVRRDTETTSPLVTIEREVLEKSSYISIEQALNELPEFMAGGPLASGAAVTSLSSAGDVAGGQGSGNMFDTARPIDNARLGTYTPGAATVNLRGLGPNRSLTLVDGRRAISSNASGAIDLNTIPQIAIANIEVITGGASSVYGADALAGVTNIKLRDNFEGFEVRARGGVNEAGGDGKEWQLSTLMGINLAGKGHAMVGIDYSKRELSLWNNRSWFRDVMASPQSGSGDYLFSVWPGYAPSATVNSGCNTAGTICTTASFAQNAGGGSNNVFNNSWAGNGPTQAAVNQVFADRTCVGLNCVTNTLGGYFFNPDGTLFVRNSNTTAVGGITPQYGPQSFTGVLGGTPEHPDEVSCSYLANQQNNVPGFQNSCTPTLNRVDYGRRLTSPRDGYTLFANADYELNEHIQAYSAISFANSNTETRREPAPTSGAFAVAIPYSSDPTAKYLPSIATIPVPGVAIGDTLPEFRTGGTRGTNCGPTGGCTMQQAFPVSAEMKTLLNSRPDVVLGTIGGAPTATSPFNGLSVCELRAPDVNAGAAGHTVQVPAANGRPAYTVQVDGNTGDTLKICGPNSAWRLQNQLMYLPPRGTVNTQTTYQLTAGLRGETGLKDWTYDWHVSQGESRTNTDYVGYISSVNYAKIITAPNYGKGYRESSLGVSNKTLTCTSGLDPFAQSAGTLQISQDCIDALTSPQTDRQFMRQIETELNMQGGLFGLPGGEVRGAIGASWRKNTYAFIPDSLRESDYIADTSAGQFGVGHVDGSVAVKEIYSELLIPLLKDLPGIRSLELELGGRYSQYTTGQDVPTYKAQLSWEPLQWLRFRGGYNRAERTPNIAELYTTTTVSSQLTGIGTDPCSSTVAAALPQSNQAANPNRAQLQALCSAQINASGSNSTSTFHANPDTFNPIGGVLTFSGDPNLKSEKGDTWTAGLVFNSPFEHALAQRITATVDWYKMKISDPIDVLSGQLILNACFNVDGTNPTYALNDPTGYCKLIDRDPVSGAVRTIFAKYTNIGELSVSGIDTSIRWSAPVADMGLASIPGNLSLGISANFLTDQSQPVTVGGVVQNFAGYVGASKLRTNTVLGYTWADSRVSLTWLYHKGTAGLLANNTPSPTVAGYPGGSLFNLTGGSRLGPVDISGSISNLFNKKPDVGGFFVADQTGGLGTFDPYGDLVGRRYSLSVTMSF
ncbi:MAG: TonB-dependent receptor [Gammaproteobacteria bacterium]